VLRGLAAQADVEGPGRAVSSPGAPAVPDPPAEQLVEEDQVLGLPGGPVDTARAVEALKDVAGETIRRPQLPLALLLVVALFLLVQNRIDRRDPKLAGSDVEEEPDLEFRPVSRVVQRVVPRPGGATA
jgi:hypothetical protein